MISSSLPPLRLLPYQSLEFLSTRLEGYPRLPIIRGHDGESGHLFNTSCEEIAKVCNMHEVVVVALAELGPGADGIPVLESYQK